MKEVAPMVQPATGTERKLIRGAQIADDSGRPLVRRVLSSWVVQAGELLVSACRGLGRRRNRRLEPA
jgi:hypothetical protein